MNADPDLGEAGGEIRLQQASWSADGGMLAILARCDLDNPFWWLYRPLVFNTATWEQTNELDEANELGFASDSEFLWTQLGRDPGALVTIYETDGFEVVAERLFEQAGISSDGKTIVGQAPQRRGDFALEVQSTLSGEVDDIVLGLDYFGNDVIVAETLPWVIGTGRQRNDCQRTTRRAR